jgi:hypothetical protein
MNTPPNPFVVSLSNHEGARDAVLRQAQDERGLGDFSKGAARLSGLIPRLLGWRPEDFWQATPAELAAILTTFEPAAEQPLSRSEFDQLLERLDDE